MSLSSTIVTAATGAAIGAFFNNRAWREKFNAEDSRRDHDEAIKVLDKLCRSFESRFYAQTDFWRKFSDGSHSNQDIEHLRSAILSWMSEFSANKSGIRVYFGRQKSIEFENEVHRFLQQPSGIMLRTHRYGYENLSLSDKLEHLSVPERHDMARRSFYVFTRELTEAIEQGRVGSARRREEEGPSGLAAKSTVYLIQRLIGLKPL